MSILSFKIGDHPEKKEGLNCSRPKGKTGYATMLPAEEQQIPEGLVDEDRSVRNSERIHP